MAFNISNLLATLDSSIAALDSASELLEVLQAINATNSTKGYGKTQRKYYTSVASLPTADSAMRGMVAVVSTAVEDSDNGLYLCTGTAWTEIQSLDSTTPYRGFQGSNFGYASGGRNPVLPTGPYLNTIDKFPFSADASASDVGDLTEARTSAAGQSSATHGYTSSGLNPELPTGPRVNTIDKFPFSADASASDVGDLIEVKSGAAGQSSSENGYTSGGILPPILNTIEKFPFAADASVSDVGDLFEARFGCTGQSSSTHGYTSGGLTTVRVNTIDKFPFSADASASDVGDLTQVRSGSAGQSSTTHGYTSGGTPPTTNIIDKFPFAADASASDVGDLTESKQGAAGQSSTTHGYTSGGQLPAASNVIDKFPFSVDASASDVGDLTEARDFPAGQQY